MTAKFAITLKFKPEYEQLILSGRKTCTTRLSRKGMPGDTFTVKDKTFVIVEVTPLWLDKVADYLHVPEGFASGSEFLDAWAGIYPEHDISSQWVQNMPVYVHWFMPEASV